MVVVVLQMIRTPEKYTTINTNIDTMNPPGRQLPEDSIS
jgi:hypothetical protein